MRALLATLLIACCALAAPAAAQDLPDTDGTVILLRHANAPGQFPDPPEFRLEDCATQRNLDDEGRAQSRALGDAFRARGIEVGKVMSSPWCRCRETAELMDMGDVEITQALRNLSGRHRSPELVARAHELFEPLVRDWKGPGALLLVTHGATMRELIGRGAPMGGMVIIRPRPEGAPFYEILGAYELE